MTWAAHFPRLHPSDFKTQTLDDVGDDWPFSYFDLEPYYDQNDLRMGVSGLADDPAYPPKRAPRMPPLPIGRMGEKAAQGFNAVRQRMRSPGRPGRTRGSDLGGSVADRPRPDGLAAGRIG